MRHVTSFIENHSFTGQMYLKVSLAMKEELRRKSVLLAKATIICKSYDCHNEATGWMGSLVILP